MIRRLKSDMSPTLNIDTLIWGAILLVLLALNANAADFNAVSGTLTVNTAKEITIADKCESAPIKLDGKLDSKQPQILKAGAGMAYRFRVETGEHLMEPAVTDSTGNVLLPVVETPYMMSETIDGAYVELYSDRIVITDLNGKPQIRTGKYSFYLISEKDARHSPVGYYVNTSGSDAAAGTSSAPWQTCSIVNRSTFAAGDTVYFAGGQTFGAAQNDTCLVAPSSGSAGSPVVFTSYGTGRATITGAKQISGWTVQPDGHTCIRLKAVADSTFAVWVKNVLGTRVMTQATLDANNEWRTTSDSTLVYLTDPADTSDVKRSKVSTITTAKSNITLSNLHLTKGTGSSQVNYNCTNISVTGGINIIIEKCKIDSSGQSGVCFASGAKPSIIKNCLFDGFTNCVNAYCDSLILYNNTFIIRNKGIIAITTAKNWTIVNNIFNSFYSLGSFMFFTTPSSNVSSNNHYYSSSYTNKWVRGSTLFSSLQSWGDSTSQESGSLTGWPKFYGRETDSTTAVTDYHLSSTSKAINAGVDVGLTTDYDGRTILGTPDIGALEYAPIALQSNTPVNVLRRSLYYKATVTDTGMGAIDSVGVIWNTTGTFSAADSSVVRACAMATADTFTVYHAERAPSRKYYYWTMAHNAYGWYYAAKDSVTMLEVGPCPTSLVHDTMLQHFYFCGDANYLYGRAHFTATTSSGQLVRETAAGTVTLGKNFADIDAEYAIYSINSTSVNGTILVTIMETDTDKFYLFKSVDGGANFGDNAPAYDDEDYVLRYGWDGSTHIANVNNLKGQGIQEVTIGTSKVILLGEYNINQSRTDGSTNDQMRLMKSTDMGGTWAEVIHWNTDGSNNNIKHIHQVRQDPYTKDIYWSSGDNDNQTAIWRWNGTSDISTLSNHPPLWYVTNSTYATQGLSVGATHDDQAFRAGDLLFDANYIYWSCDTFAAPATKRGLWRGAKDLSSSAQIDTQIQAIDAGYTNFNMRKTEIGLWICCSFDNNATDLNVPVFISADGIAWSNAGSTLSDTGGLNVSFIPMFEWNDKVYMPAATYKTGFYGSGGTLVLSQSLIATPSSSTALNVPYMTYYLDAVSGNDSDRGNATGHAWKTSAQFNRYPSYKPGDYVKLTSGQVHSAADTTFKPAVDGSLAGYITLTSTNPSNPATIDAAKFVTTGWAAYAPVTDGWFTVVTAPDDSSVFALKFQGAAGTRVTTKALMTSDRKWQRFSSGVATVDTIVFRSATAADTTKVQLSVNYCLNMGGSKYWTISNIKAKNGTGTNSSTTSGSFYGWGTRNRFISCAAESSFNAGFSLTSCDSTMFMNCISRNSVYAELFMRTTSDTDTLYNCTFYGGGTYGAYIDSTANLPVIKNCIIQNTAAAVAMRIFKKNVLVTGYVGNNNIFKAGQTNVLTYGYGTGTSYSTIDTWATATGQDANSRITDPLFVNIVAGNFRSRYPNFGANLYSSGVKTDLTGRSRMPVGAFNVGAYGVSYGMAFDASPMGTTAFDKFYHDNKSAFDR